MYNLPSTPPAITSAISYPFISPLGILPGDCPSRFVVSASLSNERSGDRGSWGEVGVDVEQLRIGFNYQYRYKNTAFEIGIPSQLNSSGILDPFLNAFHHIVSRDDLLNIPGKPLSFIYYTDPSGYTKISSGTHFGIGNPYISFALSPGQNVWFKSLLTLPLGNPESFNGASVPLLGLQGDWRKGHFGANVNATFLLGNPEAYQPLIYRNSIGLSVWYAPTPKFRLLAELHTSPLISSGQLSESTVRFIASYNLFSFQEDLSGSSPDVSLSVSKDFQLSDAGCK
ncbi:hypothetical protein [Deinococcus sp.]|uniref:hypothetical protein n=1 Tax=Deinococcus sp. TaxID=47478 RepID=UPI003B59AD94